MSSQTRREFLKRACLAGGGSLPWMLGRSRAAESRRPDVLFIAIEDVSPHRWGCYGNKLAHTPNLDRFAASGLRFAEAHTNPPCCPSRTALLLGKRPETTHVFGNRHDWHKLCPDAVPLPVRFRQAGYETIRCGKMYHGSFEDPPSWTRDINPNDGLPKPKPSRPGRGPGIELRRQLQREGQSARKLPGGTPFVYGPTGRDDLDEVDGRIAEQGIRVIRARKPDDKPMLLCLGFHAPHLPFRAPDKYFQYYPPEEMPIPKNPGADENGMPKPGVFEPKNPHTLEQWRESIAAHYACLSFVDAQVGRVLQALEQSGRADNTIVVIWSDHGFMLGEHFLWRKGPLRDESTMVALLWRAPGVTKPGTVCRRPVETIDIFPTLMDLCGIPLPSDIEAVSMRSLLENPDRSWKKGALMWGSRGQSIVTEKWRYCEYTRNPKRKPELFDQENDPHEFVNLAETPRFAQVVSELSGLIHGGWRACLPR